MADDVSKHWKLELTAFAAVGLIVMGAAFYFLNERASHPWTPISGVVVRTGMASDYDGNHPIIVVRLPDGRETQIPISKSQVRSCSAGRSIALLQQGAAYRVALKGCS